MNFGSSGASYCLYLRTGFGVEGAVDCCLVAVLPLPLQLLEVGGWMGQVCAVRESSGWEGMDAGEERPTG
jgi:hypothetical protein